MLADSLADLSYLCGALDTTRFAHICEKHGRVCWRPCIDEYLLRSCHDSLRHLQLNCSAVSPFQLRALFNNTYPQRPRHIRLKTRKVICSLSQFVNLREVRLDFFCVDGDDAEFTAPYLRDILKTILPHGHVLERIAITLYLKLNPFYSSDSELPQLDFYTLPLGLHAGW